MELDQLSPRAQLLRMWLGGLPLLPVVSALGGPQENNMEFHPPSKVQGPSFLLSSVSCFSFIHSTGLYHACLSWPIWPQNPSISWDDLVCSAWKTANIVNPINISWDENQEGGGVKFLVIQRGHSAIQLWCLWRGDHHSGSWRPPLWATLWLTSYSWASSW